mmetsp:Transcript_148188/g.475954  ORF Transcript_148188/g.475954 Transcript_148188/m.475954 type:complete len:257 (+) Transcript_148188:384-1154(+)
MFCATAPSTSTTQRYCSNGLLLDAPCRLLSKCTMMESTIVRKVRRISSIGTDVSMYFNRMKNTGRPKRSSNGTIKAPVRKQSCFGATQPPRSLRKAIYFLSNSRDRAASKLVATRKRASSTSSTGSSQAMPLHAETAPISAAWPRSSASAERMLATAPIGGTYFEALHNSTAWIRETSLANQSKSRSWTCTALPQRSRGLPGAPACFEACDGSRSPCSERAVRVRNLTPARRTNKAATVQAPQRQEVQPIAKPTSH